MTTPKNPSIVSLPSVRLSKLAEAHGANAPQLDLPTPNIYYVTVNSAVTGETHHLYVAADFTGSAMKKVQNICADRHGFRPYRSNSAVKMRRLRLQDYLQTPRALGLAIDTARELGEKDIVAALEKRPDDVAALLATPAAVQVDFDAVARALGEQLRTLDSLPA